MSWTMGRPKTGFISRRVYFRKGTTLRIMLRVATTTLCLALSFGLAHSAPPISDAADTSSHVLCSVDEYVRTAFEFKVCQEMAMKNFSTSGSSKSSCPLLKEIFDVCLTTTKPCFTDAGYERGKEISYFTFSLQWPEITSCSIFTPDPIYSSRRPHETCIISEEVANSREIMLCQNKMVPKLISPYDGKETKFEGEEDEQSPPVDQATKDRRRRDKFCGDLLEIQEDCIVHKLSDCYKGFDLTAHTAYLTEELKLLASSIAIHQGNLTDVGDCPVFNPEKLYPDQKPKRENNNGFEISSEATTSNVRRESEDMSVLAIVGIVFGIVLIICMLTLGAIAGYWKRDKLKDIFIKGNYGQFDDVNVSGANANASHVNVNMGARNAAYSTQPGDVQESST